MRVTRIVSGGQTGADRAALDTAREFGLSYGGWCPADGRAEDRPDPPGLLADYPELAPTPARDPAQRTHWNVRDSDATLVVRTDGVHSPGTDLTIETAARLGRPCLVTGGDADAVVAWLDGLADALPEVSREGLTLNVAGPRESEQPGSYRQTRALLERILRPDD